MFDAFNINADTVYNKIEVIIISSKGDFQDATVT